MLVCNDVELLWISVNMSYSVVLLCTYWYVAEGPKSMLPRTRRSVFFRKIVSFQRQGTELELYKLKE